MPLEKIADLTDYQLCEVYFRPRDENGKLVRAEEDENPAWKHPSLAELNIPEQVLGDSNREYAVVFWQVWTRRGLKGDEILEKWLTRTE